MNPIEEHGVKIKVLNEILRILDSKGIPEWNIVYDIIKVKRDQYIKLKDTLEGMLNENNSKKTI